MFLQSCLCRAAWQPKVQGFTVSHCQDSGDGPDVLQETNSPPCAILGVRIDADFVATTELSSCLSCTCCLFALPIETIVDETRPQVFDLCRTWTLGSGCHNTNCTIRSYNFCNHIWAPAYSRLLPGSMPKHARYQAPGVSIAQLPHGGGRSRKTGLKGPLTGSL